MENYHNKRKTTKMISL